MTSCNQPDESQRYKPFTQAFNLALDRLKDVETPLRPYDETDPKNVEMLLHVHSTRRIIGFKGSKRSPDIVNVGSKAEYFSRRGITEWAQAVLEACENPAKNIDAIPWCAVNAALEFKKVLAVILGPPKTPYSLAKEFKEKPHQIFVDYNDKQNVPMEKVEEALEEEEDPVFDATPPESPTRERAPVVGRNDSEWHPLYLHLE